MNRRELDKNLKDRKTGAAIPDKIGCSPSRHCLDFMLHVHIDAQRTQIQQCATPKRVKQSLFRKYRGATSLPECVHHQITDNTDSRDVMEQGKWRLSNELLKSKQIITKKSKIFQILPCMACVVHSSPASSLCVSEGPSFLV
jgi:hypothetical protein